MTIVKATDSYRVAGVYEPIEYTVERRICDECKSSDISEMGNHVSVSINGAFTLVIIVSFYGALIVGAITHDVGICGGIGMVSVIALLILLCWSSYVERNNYWKCNTCGNEHIT